MRNKAVLLLVVAALLMLFFALDLWRFLSLAYLKESQAALIELHAQSPWLVRSAYFGLYVAVAALSLPGAAMLTLAGGAVLGWGWAMVLVSFASTIGATASFLLARFVLRDWVHRRFDRQLRKIDRDMEQEGVFYLFGLRLVPLVPFVVVNLAMGLTQMRAWTFYWVSQLGMLAGTAVYVNAGTQLGSIRSPADIVSAGLLGSLVLLGLLPWLAHRTLAIWRLRQAYAPWKSVRPKRYDCNVVVIGAGAGGLVSAYIAAAAQAKVALVEAGALGGDCLNHGCVPSKALVHCARLAHAAREAAHLGLQGPVAPPDFRAVMRQVQAAIAAIAPHDSVERYKALGVDVRQGHARILNPWTVEIAMADSAASQRLTTRSIILATGSRPVLPPIEGLAEAPYVTTDSLWEHLATLDAAPPNLLIVGGGSSACELAQSMARLGSQVTLIEQTARILPTEDAAISAWAQAALAADGVRVLVAHRAVRCTRQADLHTLIAQHHDGKVDISFDLLLCCTGRTPRLDNLGLEALGIPVTAPLQINAYLQTRYPNILAVGDVTGQQPSTHFAAHQAWYGSVNALFGSFKRTALDATAIPRTVFMDPEIACIGLHAEQADAQGIAFEETVFALADLDRAILNGATTGLVRVLTVPGRDTILGVSMAGPHTAEAITEFALAMRQGLGLRAILRTVHAYPTMGEASRRVAAQWQMDHAPQWLLPWARRFQAWRRGEGIRAP